MAIAFKGSGAGSGTESNGASLDLVCPASVAANDILIAHVLHTGITTNPTTPSGWTLLYPNPADITQGAPVGTGTATARHWAFGKLAVGNEDGTTVGFGTGGGTNGRAGRIYSFDGYVSGTITDVVPFASFSDIPTETDPSGPTVTTTVAGAKAIALMCQDDDNTHTDITGESGGTWANYLEFVSSTLGPQGLSLQFNFGTPDADPGTITGGTLAGTNDESGTIGFEIRPNAPIPALDDYGHPSLMELVAGVALGLALATTSLAAQQGNELANAHQDEIGTAVPVGDTAGNAPDLWSRSSTTPRLTLLYADDVIVAQPAQPALEHEIAWEPPFTVPATVSLELHETQDEWVEEPVPTLGDPASSPVDLWARQSTTPRTLHLYQDDGLVEQPSTTIVEESDWQPPIVVESEAWGPVPWQYGAYEGIGEEVEAPPATEGDSPGSPPDLWARSISAPRFTQLYQDDGLVPQPAPLAGDEGAWTAPVSPRRVLALEIQTHQDERVDQPAAGTPLDDGSPSEPPRPIASPDVWMPVPWAYGYGEGSVWGPIAEVYEVPLVRIRTRAILPREPDTDAIVAQPAALGFDEGVYVAPFTVPAVRSLRIEQWQDERVAQPSPLAFDAGTWEAPFSVPETLALEVQQTQDERIEPPAPLPFDEGTWEPGFHVPAVIAFPLVEWMPADVWMSGLFPGWLTARLTVDPLITGEVSVETDLTGEVSVEPLLTATRGVKP